MLVYGDLLSFSLSLSSVSKGGFFSLRRLEWDKCTDQNKEEKQKKSKEKQREIQMRERERERERGRNTPIHQRQCRHNTVGKHIITTRLNRDHLVSLRSAGRKDCERAHFKLIPPKDFFHSNSSHSHLREPVTSFVSHFKPDFQPYFPLSYTLSFDGCRSSSSSPTVVGIWSSDACTVANEGIGTEGSHRR